MIEKAKTDIRAQATTDDPDAANMVKRYPKALARDYETGSSRSIKIC